MEVKQDGAGSGPWLDFALWTVALWASLLNLLNFNPYPLFRAEVGIALLGLGVSLAPAGVIEFPHKDDPMVQVLLSQRADIFPDYDNETFAGLLSQRARIVKSKDVLPTRTFYWFDRT